MALAQALGLPRPLTLHRGRRLTRALSACTSTCSRAPLSRCSPQTGALPCDACARDLLVSPFHCSFVLHYADTTELRGFHCKDHVKFGRVTGDLSFACLYHCNSPDFNDSDGILGFGRVVNDDRLPSPLFTSLTDPNNLLPGSPQLSPKFRCLWFLVYGLCKPCALIILTAFCPRPRRLSCKSAGKWRAWHMRFHRAKL